jgi:Xaa-Pro aminopeptidase
MNFSERLTAVRASLRAQGLAGFLVPHADEHLGEYLPASAERLAWLTGFTGSAGTAVVLAEEAAVWSDGRYVLQLASQTDGALWTRLHLMETPPPAWIAARISDGVLGFDPWLISEEGLRPFRDAGVTLRAVTTNPIDANWHDRPAPPPGPAVPHALEYAGETSAAKRERLAAILAAQKQDAAIITDPASLAWLLNIRGSDVESTPFALGFAVLHADQHVDLFMDGAKLPPETRAWLGNQVGIAERAALPAALAALAGRRVRVDAANTAAWFADTLRAAGATVVNGADPCLVPKARKNPVEQEGARRAHGRDAVALSRFLHWAAGAGGRETEISASDRLEALRAEGALFRGVSFPSISGAGEHGAIMHYRATPESNRPIKPNEVYLIDSGGQYLDGTTDVTRTIWTGPDAPPPSLRDQYTRVLKGHIAIATMVFPENVAGVRLDAFARAALWQAGLDYDHGTGHGVGSYLSVHEGPVSISPHLRPAVLAEGMIVSNEPGYYLPGSHGIRIENLLLVRPAGTGAGKPFLRFEDLTLAPYDRTLIDPALLRPDERAWVDAYHARVLQHVRGQVPGDVAAWLERVCAPLETV